MRIAVIGHVEHITLGRVAAVPRAGEIAHMDSPRWLAGGGGGMAFFQLTRCPVEVLLYTALGNDEAAAQVASRLSMTSARVHAARRDEAHTRDVVMITPDGERTIVVVGEPLHPSRSDPLPWDDLGSCDAVYFTGHDPASLQAARAARVLVVSARRRASLDASGVRADVVVGSALDPREAATRTQFTVAPAAVVLTEGARGGVVQTASGSERFRAPPSPPVVGSAYGAGDSFAAALTFYLASRMPLLEACERAGRHGAAVLGSVDPVEAQIPPPP